MKSQTVKAFISRLIRDGETIEQTLEAIGATIKWKPFPQVTIYTMELDGYTVEIDVRPENWSVSVKTLKSDTLTGTRMVTDTDREGNTYAVAWSEDAPDCLTFTYNDNSRERKITHDGSYAYSVYKTKLLADGGARGLFAYIDHEYNNGSIFGVLAGIIRRVATNDFPAKRRIA